MRHESMVQDNFVGQALRLLSGLTLHRLTTCPASLHN